MTSYGGSREVINALPRSTVQKRTPRLSCNGSENTRSVQNGEDSGSDSGRY